MACIIKKSQPKVIFLALIYADVAHDSDLYTELVQELVRAGIDIHVVAPSLISCDEGLRLEGGVPVLRVKTGRLFQKNLISKAFNNILLPVFYYLRLRKYLRIWSPSWIIFPTPPITLTPLVCWLKWKCKGNSYLILRDIFPQNAVDLGFIKKVSPVYWFFRILEKWTYFVSDKIGCMSPKNIKYVLDHNSRVGIDKLHLLPNWIAENHAEAKSSQADYRSKFRVLDDELLCVFGGNLGKPQQVGFLVDVAELLRNDLHIRLVIVGRGTEMAALQNDLVKQKLSNIAMYPSLPRDEYQQLLSAADVGLILLSECFTIPNIPSRLTGYWAAGVPVLAATDTATDLYEAFLKPYGGGEWVKMGDAHAFADKLRWFAENPKLRREMGEKGRQAILRNFTAKKAASTIIARTGMVSLLHQQ